MSRLIVWPVTPIRKILPKSRGTMGWEGLGTSLSLDTNPGLVLYRGEVHRGHTFYPEYYLTREDRYNRDSTDLVSLEGDEALLGFQASTKIRVKGLFTKTNRLTNKKCKCKKCRPIPVSVVSGMPRGKQEEIRQVRCSKCMGLLKGM